MCKMCTVDKLVFWWEVIVEMSQPKVDKVNSFELRNWFLFVIFMIQIPFQKRSFSFDIGKQILTLLWMNQ